MERKKYTKIKVFILFFVPLSLFLLIKKTNLSIKETMYEDAEINYQSFMIENNYDHQKFKKMRLLIADDQYIFINECVFDPRITITTYLSKSTLGSGIDTFDSFPHDSKFITECLGN